MTMTTQARQLFGTDGIRGVAGEFPLTLESTYLIGRALGHDLIRSNRKARVVIGQDTRESSGWIADRVALGLSSVGVEVHSAGVITTPGVAYLARSRKYDAGVVISASHNPYHDNGVKLFSNAGMKFPDSVEETLEQDIFKQRSEKPPKNPAVLVADESLDADYLKFLRSRVIPGAKLSSLRIVLDCANGAAYKLGPELFQSLGANVIAMADQPDGRNINAGCGSLHLEDLQKRVVAERATLGVAFDGDADRALFISASGKIINGDGVLLASARFLKSQGKLKGNRVVATSMSNLGLERVLAREGIDLGRAAVGDRYVLEEMFRCNNVLGGEQSGHVIFLDDSPAGDGLLTALKIASLVSTNGRLESLITGLKDYPQVIVNVKVKSKPPLDSLPEVSRALAEAQSALGENGRVVLRYSGTEPLARVMVEAELDSDVQRFSQSVADALRHSIGA